MFSISSPIGPADFFLLPPSVAAAVQDGPAVEEVHFLRDEMANMVWGVESVIPNGIGAPRPGHERDVAEQATPVPSAAPPVPEAGPPLRYRIQTTVPTNWIPFLPVVVDLARGQIALERSAMLRTAPDGTVEPIGPLGKVLQPTTLHEQPYLVREEEVPRSGLRVARLAHRARWTDGSTHLWAARRKTAGGGEGTSGLRFDEAVPTIPSGG